MKPDSQIHRAHGYHPLRVKSVIRETEDATSFVLDVPPSLGDLYRYESGQFCTFKVYVGGNEYLRSYSMSSAPQTDADLIVTVKRVPGGVVSNWLLDNVSEGDVLTSTPPAGVFCLKERNVPVVAFCGGSGITPVISIAKQALASTQRTVKIVYANRSTHSVIFKDALQDLLMANPGRLEIVHHYDADAGFLTADLVCRLVDRATDADFYICGPGPFMDLVEDALLGMGVAAPDIFIERFTAGSSRAAVDGHLEAAAGAATVAAAAAAPDSVTILLRGKRTTVAYQKGDTLLETARRGGLQPPFSCESGSCATCMALLREGTAWMRVNDALTEDEVADGWVLTCQAVPSGSAVTVEYEAL